MGTRRAGRKEVSVKRVSVDVNSIAASSVLNGRIYTAGLQYQCCIPITTPTNGLQYPDATIIEPPPDKQLIRGLGAPRRAGG